MAASGLNSLRDRWERLTERERMIVGAFGLLVVALAMVAVGWWVGGGLSSIEDNNDRMVQALKALDAQRDVYQRSRAKAEQLGVRLGRTQVQLEGLLEAAARESQVEIAETTERQPLAVGNKKYIERAVDLRLRRVGLSQLANFLRKIETGPNLVVVTSLSMRVRDDRHEDLEVEMTVSTWEHAPEAKPGRKKEGPEKPGEAGKEGKG